MIGASGSGKTTVLQVLERTSPPECKIVYFDSIGVPTLEEMKASYGSPEEWQRIKTSEWTKKIKESFLSEFNVIIDVQTRPEFIEKACLENNIASYKVVLFDCSDVERARRLFARRQPELVNNEMSIGPHT
ncbi:MAG: hypothetical protein JWO53_874 [Chlamydiia bacterium]|nr:hypothetical protein [Chlamydiia bacterium]